MSHCDVIPNRRTRFLISSFRTGAESLSFVIPNRRKAAVRNLLLLVILSEALFAESRDLLFLIVTPTPHFVAP
jgi:hypothetical protein